MRTDQVTVLSLGAGVQSSALLLACDRGELGPRPDFAVFADTGDEPAGVYTWLDRLEAAVSIPVVRASRGHMSVDMLAGKTSGRAPWFIRNPDGSVGMLRRQCTGDYKIDVITRAIRDRLGYQPRQRVKHQVTTLIGISADEAHRMKPSSEPWRTNAWPLVDARWRRPDCVAYVQRTGLGTPPRSACVMCPFRSDDEWIAMRDHDPEAFGRAVAFDRQVRTALPSKTADLQGEVFVHRSARPLDEVSFRPSVDPRQGMLFGNECAGVCGV